MPHIAASTPGAIHIVLQGKSGVGKSFVALPVEQKRDSSCNLYRVGDFRVPLAERFRYGISCGQAYSEINYSPPHAYVRFFGSVRSASGRSGKFTDFCR